MNNENLSFAVKERLQYIEFLLQFRGWLARGDLVDKFDISAPAATRDFRKYKELAPNNLDFDDSGKKYIINEAAFSPMYPLKINEALGKLRSPALAKSLGLGEGESFTVPPRLSLPRLNVLMSISRAILNGNALQVNYLSVQNGESSRVIAPHSIVDNGLRLHIRAYDYKRNKFCDFVLGRIISAHHSDKVVLSENSRKGDNQWNRFIRLELAPHPNKNNVQNSITIEHDFGMVDGAKTLEVRAAVAGYWLRLWNVDCTKDASLLGSQYQLWLRNHETLYDVESAKLAPNLN